MKRLLLCALALLPLLANATTKAAPTAATQPRVSMETTMGTVVFELDAQKAPKTVANFLAYVKEDGYRNSLFHRVIPGFVVQGGGYDGNYQSLPSHAPVQNESKNGLSNRRGTIAMARTSDPHSATRQFYVNLQITCRWMAEPIMATRYLARWSPAWKCWTRLRLNPPASPKSWAPPTCPRPPSPSSRSPCKNRCPA